MPLSEEEARLLEQLERSLAAEDPEFASALRGTAFTARHRRIALLSGLAFVAGIVLLLVGAVFGKAWVGGIGFAVMVAGAYGFVQSWRWGVLPGQAEEVSRITPKHRRQGFIERMEQRWQKRRDEGHF